MALVNPEPRLIVFDLDFTLWDCGGLWVDCTSPPFKKSPDGLVTDSSGRNLRLYPDIPEILDYIDEWNIEMALASRTERPDWARQVLTLLGYHNRFNHQEIFPSSKVAHFANLHRDTGIPYEEMLFFDDERRNIIEVSKLGVKCVEVKNGTDWRLFRHGMSLFGKID